MTEHSLGENYRDLGMAILERAVDDRRSRHDRIRLDAEAFLADTYPRDLYLSWWCDDEVMDRLRDIVAPA
jgi:hypothetical protein